ncbi:MAG: Asp-tRNA(Asn)/Glu-tRNA(Gln) amidotransferase subunit GatB [Bacilli bacterium]|nr:Asp-tRNA(Asn)/Glu-tRNA(Gln) amidotransferase subunit GatB [Bacilli bacterium]
MPVIGLEVHCELKSNSKNFSRAMNGEGEVNTNLAVVDIGYPGILPVVNKEAVRSSLKVALALHCEVPEKLSFDRKNYYYPDLPKGYQITQFGLPIGTNGYVMINVDGVDKKITIQDTHLEEDTANMDHRSTYSLIDYNRAGVPLLETVTDPCIGSAKEAIAYLEALRNIFLYLGVSDARADKGQIRVDVNISLKKEEDEKLGTRVEMKNINSFTTVREAIEVEIKRQTEILESGGIIEQETRRYDEINKCTHFMRGKVDAVDYKYYREPNIPEIKLTEEFVNGVRDSMPVLEYERKQKYINEYGISSVDAGTLTKDKNLSDYFEEVISYGVNPKDTSNIIVGFLLGYLNKNYKDISDISINAKDFSEIIKMMTDGKISNKQVKDIFTKALDENINVLEVAKSMGTQISDPEEIRKIINEVFNENSKVVDDYKSGKNVNGFIIGLVMKKTGGKVNPGVTNMVLREELEKL